MMRPPQYVLDRYGGLRGFRVSKRAQLQLVWIALSILREGCAFFPSGSKHVETMVNACELLRQEMSVKQWR